MQLSEPGGELREALEGVRKEWKVVDPSGLMPYNDFLSPEIESALRMTIRFLLREHVTYLESHERQTLVDRWTRQFAIILREKRPEYLDEDLDLRSDK